MTGSLSFRCSNKSIRRLWDNQLDGYEILINRMKTYLELLEESLPKPEHPRYAAWQAYALSGEERAAPVVKILQELAVLPATKILDLGCGDGGHTIALSRTGAMVTAIDIDRASVTRTKTRLTEQNCYASVLLASAETLPLASCSMDVVIAQDMIEHVDDPIRILLEANRVLRAGGFCLISVANRLALANIVSDPHWGLLGVTLMPRWLAAWYVCKIRRRTQHYDVWYIPSRKILFRWLSEAQFGICGEESPPSNPFSDYLVSVISVVAMKVI